jgi:hypothetical protein
MPQPPICVVGAAELRQMFQTHDFLGRLQRGELKARLIRERQFTTARPGLPSGTRSQIIAYDSINGGMVAIVHQYLLPDGSIGASGLPDPKRLLVKGLLYIVVQ